MPSYKSKVVAYLLLILFGWVGAHKFYLNKIGMGILYLFTFGFLGIGVFIDLFTLSGQVDLYNAVNGTVPPNLIGGLLGGNRNNNQNTNNIVVNIPSGVVATEKTNSEKLIEISDLKDKGIITQEEFESEKKKILGDSSAS